VGDCVGKPGIEDFQPCDFSGLVVVRSDESFGVLGGLNGNLCGVMRESGKTCGNDDKRARGVSGCWWVFDSENLGGGACGEIIPGAGVFLGCGNSALSVFGFACKTVDFPPSGVVGPAWFESARAVGAGGVGVGAGAVHGVGVWV
jgi:hypothetical protein